MDQWLTNAVLSIKKCGEQQCNGNGECWGVWGKKYVSGNTYLTPI